MTPAQREQIKQHAVQASRYLPGLTPESQLLWLAGAAIGKKNILEVGTYHGRSSLVLKLASQANVVTLDNQSYSWTGQPKEKNPDPEKVGVALASQGVKYLPLSLEGAKEELRLQFPLGPDLIFIDGDHSFQAVCKDIEVALEIQGERCLLCGHDLDNPGTPEVREALEFMLPGRFTQTTEWMWASFR